MARRQPRQCGLEHDHHLCQLIATNEPLDSIKELVREPTHLCLDCKRAANDPCSLCRPAPLK